MVHKNMMLERGDAREETRGLTVMIAVVTLTQANARRADRGYRTR